MRNWSGKFTKFNDLSEFIGRWEPGKHSSWRGRGRLRGAKKGANGQPRFLRNDAKGHALSTQARDSNNVDRHALNCDGDNHRVARFEPDGIKSNGKEIAVKAAQSFIYVPTIIYVPTMTIPR